MFAITTGKGSVVIDKIIEIFQKYSINWVGVADYNQLLPLIECRASQRLPQNPTSVISCLLPYYIGEYPNRNISRYTLGEDYHLIAQRILGEICKELQESYKENCFESFCDISPIREVTAGYLSGLGVVGVNNQLINPQYGSYVFIATVVTDLFLPRSKPMEGSCLHCNICVDGCPTSALMGNFNCEICLSHITQKKGELSHNEVEAIKKSGFLWGCDNCNDLCPMNKDAQKTPIADFYQDVVDIINRENLDKVRGHKALGYRGQKVLLRNLDIIENE